MPPVPLGWRLTDVSLLLSAGDDIGKYKILAVLGSGNYGTVYRVHDRALDTEKALKLIRIADPTAFKKELYEAQALRKCRHDNCVHVNEADIYHLNDEPFVGIDMEYLPQGSLETLMRQGFVGPADIVRHVSHILFGLEHAHANGVLHRDIKPANIMLSPANTKLSDFGLAAGVGTSVGKEADWYLPHRAPEMARTGTATVLTDIFAVGMTLFRLINNLVDWDGALHRVPDWASLSQQGKLVGSIGFEPWVSAKFAKVVKTACAIDPAKRYQNCREMQGALGRLRVNIDWIRDEPTEWNGLCGGKLHAISIEPSHPNLVTYRIGERRKRDLCQEYADSTAAFVALNKTVAASTFN
jgi:serine/threonine protein kinase